MIQFWGAGSGGGNREEKKNDLHLDFRKKTCRGEGWTDFPPPLPEVLPFYMKRLLCGNLLKCATSHYSLKSSSSILKFNCCYKVMLHYIPALVDGNSWIMRKLHLCSLLSKERTVNVSPKSLGEGQDENAVGIEDGGKQADKEMLQTESGAEVCDIHNLFIFSYALYAVGLCSYSTGLPVSPSVLLLQRLPSL